MNYISHLTIRVRALPYKLYGAYKFKWAISRLFYRLRAPRITKVIQEDIDYAELLKAAETIDTQVIAGLTSCKIMIERLNSYGTSSLSRDLVKEIINIQKSFAIINQI